MASPDQVTQTTKLTTVDEFLAKHPEIILGREKLNRKRDETEAETEDNSFESTTKPFANVVLVQTYHGDTNQRLWVAALVDDAQADNYYWEEVNGGKCDLCALQIEKQDPEKLLQTVYGDMEIQPDHDCKAGFPDVEEDPEESQEGGQKAE